MTDDQLRAFCLAADPVDYWAGVTAWRPSSLCDPEPGEGSPTVLKIYVIPPIAGGDPGLVDDIVNAIIGPIWDAVVWLWDNVAAWLIWVKDHVWAGAEWLWGNIETWLIWVKDHVWDAAEWVWGNAAWLFDWVIDQLWDAADWLWGNVSTWLIWVKDHVWDAGQWILDNVLNWVNWLGEQVWAGVDFVWDAISPWFSWLGDNVWSAGQWILESVYGWVVWLNDQLFSTVIAGAEIIINGLVDVFHFIVDEIGEIVSTVVDGIVGGIRDIVSGPVDLLVETVDRKLAIPGKLIRGEYPDLLAFLDDLVDPPFPLVVGLIGAIVLGMVISITTASVMTILVEPLTEPYVQNVRAGVGAQLLQPVDIREAWNRGFIDEGVVDDHLSRAGYSGPALEALKALRMRLPSPADLVRFGVREVYTPEVAERFGQFEDFPPQFATEMALQGYDEQTALNYWAAHWDLPSVTQGFEMLHRGVIDLPTLELLLRAQDVMPFWRDKLVDIAYTLPSRVDLRRMLKADIITERDVLEGYTKRGYDDFWAQALTDFAVAWATPDDESELDTFRELTASQIRLAYRRHVVDREEALERLVEADYTEVAADFLLALDDAWLALHPDADADVDVRELTRTDILRAYRDGIWTREQTQMELEVQGYLPTSADLILSHEDVVMAHALTDAQVGLVRQRYVSYEIDEAAALQELTALGVSPDWCDIFLAEWTIDRQGGTRHLSLAQLRRANQRGVITDQAWFDGLLVLGYTPSDAETVILTEIPEPEIVVPAPPAAPPPEAIPEEERQIRRRDLERSIVERLYSETLIDGAEVLQRLALLRFDPADAALLLRRLDTKLSQNKVGQAYRLGQVARDQTVLQYRLVGFTEADAERIVALIDEELEVQRQLRPPE